MKKRHLALVAAFLATTIYGINHTIAKEVMPIYIGSFGFIMLRLLGATALFWTISLFTPKEKVERNDFIVKASEGHVIKQKVNVLSRRVQISLAYHIVKNGVALHDA